MQEVHSAPKAAGLGDHLEPWELGGRFFAVEPSAEHLVHDLFEALSAVASQLLELSGDIII